MKKILFFCVLISNSLLATEYFPSLEKAYQPRAGLTHLEELRETPQPLSTDATSPSPIFYQSWETFQQTRVEEKISSEVMYAPLISKITRIKIFIEFLSIIKDIEKDNFNHCSLFKSLKINGFPATEVHVIIHLLSNLKVIPENFLSTLPSPHSPEWGIFITDYYDNLHKYQFPGTLCFYYTATPRHF